ncbi:MAG: hypothetical protein GKR88_10370 [Flavobacteriaceae bacterium]|nr:MAG: hypothetical protein GKR88_10370 [Flavobacteriaceae bacterium]
MKKYSIILLYICFSINSFSQINEIGVFAGVSNYIGDIGSTNYLKPKNAGFGIIYKWNLNPRIAFRGTYTYIPIKGDDANAENRIRQIRGLNFKNTINEFALGIEFNFFEYDLSSGDKTFTPYIVAGIAALDYQAVKSVQSLNNYTFARNTSVALPVGFGFKSKIYGKLAYSIETQVRYTFTDGLDYSTSEFPQLNYGGSGNDWYMFTGISLMYTFGRSPCYSNRK